MNRGLGRGWIFSAGRGTLQTPMTTSGWANTVIDTDGGGLVAVASLNGSSAGSDNGSSGLPRLTNDQWSTLLTLLNT